MLKGNWGSRDKAPYILNLCTTLILRTVISFLIPLSTSGQAVLVPTVHDAG